MIDELKLEEQIIYHNNLYRKGTPIISDRAYDELVEALRTNFPDSNILKKGVIETVPNGQRKQELPIPMYSLDKFKSIAELREWTNQFESEVIFILTSKFDGISLVNREDGLKYAAWTRGDGEYGQLSTLHFLKSDNKMSIQRPGFMNYSFGEAIMSKKNFQKYADEYANPRNLVGGLLNRDVPGEELMDVDYIRYGSDSEQGKMVQLSYLNRHSKIECMYKVLRNYEIKKMTDQELFAFLDALYVSFGEEYENDGLVIDVDNGRLRRLLGREENNNPKYAKAIKFPEWDKSVTTEVVDVVWKVSKQGKIKPVMNVKPVSLAGVTVSNATGYNAKYVFDNNIAKGSFIELTRSGSVIPKHLDTVSHVEENVADLMWKLETCPCCGHNTYWDETHTELMCPNEECKEKIISKLAHFFNTLKIEDFGEPSIISLYEAGFKTRREMLDITVSQMSAIPGFGESSANTLIRQFDKLRSEGVSLARYIHAIDIMEGKLGEKTIQTVIDGVNSIFKATIPDMVKIKDIADTTATIVYNHINEVPGGYDGIKIVESTKGHINVCFTGVRPSKDQEKLLISADFNTVDGVSKTVHYLVVKDLNSTSSKMKKAKELGITIIDMEGFLKKLY